MSTEQKYITQEQLDDTLKAFERKMKKLSAPPKPPREPNEYNIFVKEKMLELKRDNPKITNKDAFKECASLWNKVKVSKFGHNVGSN